MENKIVLNKESMEKQIEVHLVPCKIMYDGECDVKSYFSSSIQYPNAEIEDKSVQCKFYFIR